VIADLRINRKSAIGVPENVLRGVVMWGPEAFAGWILCLPTVAGTIQPRDLPKSCRMFHPRCFPPCTGNLNPNAVMMKSAKHGA
jgi:hypothetical protein